MARMRSIKPEMFRSLTVSGWPVAVRWTFAGLLTYLDDSGRGIDDERLVKAEVYPVDDDTTARKVGQHLTTIAAHGPLCRYQVAGKKYLHVTSWREHQRINRPTSSRIPPCPTHESPVSTHVRLSEDSVSPHDTISEGSPPTCAPAEHGSRDQGSREGEQGTRELPPAADEHPPPPKPTQTRTTTPPTARRVRCPGHAYLQPDDPGPACHDCKQARLAAADIERQAVLDTQHAIRACRYCDADGRRLDLLGQRSTATRCDHQPHRPDPEPDGADELAAIRHQAQAIPCPDTRCPAGPGQPCVDSDGHQLPRAPAHAARIAAARKVPA
jgi:hypothetical protein